ncbi:hypothetical protein N9B94_04725, partial [Verrucomicrobia bacterium]|nr:hypothetical protein [Verrucomicrobiota bacterium]
MSKPNIKQGWSERPAVHLALMVVVLLFLFRNSFDEGFVHFSNDTPLGGEVAQWDYLNENLNGSWQPLYWLGNENIANRPTVGLLFGIIAGDAVIHHKFFPIFSLWLLGACAWFCFRQLGIRPQVCLLGGLAAMLNMSAFSNTCWGLPYWQISRAMGFLAIGLAFWSRVPKTWMRFVIAGGCVGMSVMEGFDMGAMYSVVVASIVFCRLYICDSGKVPQRIGRNFALIAIMAAMAGLVATHAISSLVGTQLTGVAGTEQTEAAKEQRWDFATQWSLPKKEILRFAIPGIFGYRMDEPGGGQYWGSVGKRTDLEDLKAWAEQNPQAKQILNSPNSFRYSGSGEHAGVLVLLLAAWALVMTLPGAKSSYTKADRTFIWCLAGIALISLFLAFGRHAPFYRLFYEIPYASTVRNPIKFTQAMHVALCFLFVYGLNDLWTRFIDRPERTAEQGLPMGAWAKTLPSVALGWFRGSLGFVGFCLLALIVYTAKKTQIVTHMTDTAIAAEMATKVFDFSLTECVLFIIFLTASVATVHFATRGKFAMGKGSTALAIMALILIVDMGRSNAYWVKHLNYADEYKPNPLLSALKENAHEGRVTIAPNPGAPAMNMLEQLYRVNWLHKQFQFYKIQSLDIAQEPRVGEDKARYLTEMQKNPLRYWQLSNTRYLLGLNKINTQQGEMLFSDVLNLQLDNVKRRFKMKMPFRLSHEPGSEQVDVVPDPNGQFALIEFAGALPRAGLYTDWEVIADDAAL